MLIVCPSCATSCHINPTPAGRAGRTLHCARCDAAWPANESEDNPDAAALPDRTMAPAELAPAPGLEPSLAAAIAGFSPFSAAANDCEFTAQPVELMAEIDIAALTTQPPCKDLAMTAEAGAEEPSEMIDVPALVTPIDDVTPEQTANSDFNSEYFESFAARQRRLRARRKEKRRSSGWSPFILVLIACNVTTVGARSEVVRYLPQTASLFAAIGLPVNLRQLEFESVRIAKDGQDGALIVQGAIISSASKSIEVPRLRFAARNSTGQEIYTWSARPSRSILAPGERLAFSNRLPAPPPDARDVMVRFFNAQDAAAAK